MGKRLLILITVLLMTGIFAGWYFFTRESKYFGTSPLKAVSVEAPFFVRIRNLGDFASRTVSNKNWQALRNIPQISGLYRDFVFIDSLILHHKERAGFLMQKELIFVPGDSSGLFLMEIGSINEKNSIHSMIRDYFQPKKIVATESTYKDASIQHYDWKDDGVQKRILMTIYKGILIVGHEAVQLQKALEQTENPSVLEDSDFLRVNKNSMENSDLNIYFNHRTLPAWLSRYFADSTSTGIFQPDYAQWTEVDVLQKENQLLINGFSVADTTRSFWVDIYKHQKPLETSLLSMMPSVTSYFTIQSLSNPVQYFADYQKYLEKKGKWGRYTEQLSSLSSELHVDIRQYLTDNWKGEAAEVFTGNNLENSEDNRFLLLSVRSGEKDPLVAAMKKKAASNKKSRDDSESADAGRDNIWEVPIESFGIFLGESSLGRVKTKWMTLGDGFIIMGATPGSLRRYLNSLRIYDLAQGKSSYQKFTSGLSRTSNFYMWCAPGQALPFFEQAFRIGSYQSLKKIASELVKLENVAWQWSYEKGMLYNTASLNVNPAAAQNRIPFWSYPLKAKMRNRPIFVNFSANNSLKEIVFQDVENFLTILDRDGIERWRIRLEGPILGEIKLIDYRKNGEYQLLFNTRDFIHLINRSGTEMRNYPIRLKSGATNEISVFDYEGKKEYRYLLAGRDRKVYNFDQYGKLIPGWQPKATQKEVELPVRYFKVGSKEFIVYFDHNKTYILDRQGKERVRLADDFVHSKNNLSLVFSKGNSPSLVTTDDQGKIRLIGLDGAVKKIVAGNFSPNHNFLPVADGGGGSSAFLFLDQQILSMYDFTGKLIFTQPVSGLTNDPVLLSVDANMKLIEIYCLAANRSVFLKNDGSVYDTGLPEEYTLSAIGSFDDKSNVSNILAYSVDGFLSNFQMDGK